MWSNWAKNPAHPLSCSFVEDRLATLKNVIKEPGLDGWNLYLGIPARSHILVSSPFLSVASPEQSCAVSQILYWNRKVGLQHREGEAGGRRNPPNQPPRSPSLQRETEVAPGCSSPQWVSKSAPFHIPSLEITEAANNHRSLQHTSDQGCIHGGNNEKSSFIAGLCAFLNALTVPMFTLPFGVFIFISKNMEII